VAGPPKPGAAARHAHWQDVYRGRAPEAASWYQPEPTVSLALIAATGLPAGAGVIDVGGGASTLVDCLLDRGFDDLTVLDVAEDSLAAARARLGDRAARVAWIAADVTAWSPDRRWDLWHDRAVFHFLTAPADQRAYVAALDRALAPGGHVVIATFAPEGPDRCSGLPVVRYDEARLGAALGPGFRFVESRREDHRTPGGATQAFLYQRYRRN
jgi:SAM-dependent methyltransferase